MKRGLSAGAALVLLLTWWLWQRHGGGVADTQLASATPAGLRIAGGDGGGLPRAPPADEMLDEASLQRAVALATAGGATAFLVARHGHLLAEHYAASARADTPVNGGAMTAALLTLVGNDSNRLSAELWQPLNAHDAWLDGCCLQARSADWLRVGILLAQEGRFEGSDIVPAVAIKRLRAAATVLEPGDKASGAESFATRDVYYLRGEQRTRLWVAPTLQLVALQVAGPAGPNGWDETQLFNLVLRAVLDQPAAVPSGDPLNQLVPGH